MAVNKAWMAIAWLLAIAALPACATSGGSAAGAGGGSSSGSTSGGGGEGGQSDPSGAGGSGGDDGSGGGGGGDGNPACGDGKIATTESCDDGNTLDGDGCSGACEFEQGWTCAGVPSKCSPKCGDGLLLGDEECDDGNAKKGDGCNLKCAVEDGWNCDAASPSVCNFVCGDGIISGQEECDDGDTNSDDGCSSVCQVEPGYSCVSSPSVCKAQCGDGLLAMTELCDDHNFAPGDGCDAECNIEDHWTCTGSPSACVTPCGDGLQLGPETCDDGNTALDDGCNATCSLEVGWSCSGQPSTCATLCGDGHMVGPEKCDDGNTKGNDGCNVNCKVEPGWTCSVASPSACATICGDGLPVGIEGCDDGNLQNNDGCAVTCQPETGYICSNSPSTCITLCGDGVAGGPEKCDDGNSVNGDGCDTSCAVEQGWTCVNKTGAGTVCTGICGDGLVVSVEPCDDGNLVDNDCCSATCQAEPSCEIESNNSISDANDFDVLSDSGLIKGSIKPAGESDFYSIVLAPDTTFALTAETLNGTTPNCFTQDQDSTLNLYDANGQKLATDDESGTGHCALLVAGSLQSGPSGSEYYVEVKGSNAGASFSYSLQITTEITICGDGIKNVGEQCDDGNTANGDGCNSSCFYETYSEIEPNNTSAQATTNGPFPLNALWSGAVPTAGDIDIYQIDLAKTADLSIETFDGAGPGNCVSIDTKVELLSPTGASSLASDDNDGLNSCSLINAVTDAGVRHLYPGKYFVKVTHNSTTGVIPAYMVEVQTTALCGNGTKEGTEPCDGTPNCDANCDLVPFCGDGIVIGIETCDDGNVVSGDGCSSDCQLETVCGDNTVAGTEICDDGNVVNGDGCSSTCQIEGATNEVEANNNFPQADTHPTISGSTILVGSIGVVGDKDIFKLNVAATSVIRFETFQGLATSDCTSIATTLRLFDSTKAQIKTDAPDAVASGINSCAAMVVRLDPGTYYLQVEESGNDAKIPIYKLQIQLENSLGNEVEPNETQAQATALTGTDVYVFGGHLVEADLDFYSITVPAGKSIRAEVVEGDTIESCESNGIDTFLSLFNATATSLATDDDDGRGFCSAIDGTGASSRDTGAHNLAAGTYFLQVKAFSTGAGAQFNYHLAITVR